MTEAELWENLQDQKWRLNNLYYITDKKGKRVLFRMNKAQEEFFDNLHYKNIILKARQLGFSTFLQILMLDMAIFYPDTNCGVIAQTLRDAHTLFRTKVLYAYENLPALVRNAVRDVTKNKSELILSNGSSIVVGTSLRSGTYQYLHISEFGKISARSPDRAEEIVTGALNTQEPEGWAFIESTAEGQEGRFFEFVQRARAMHNKGDDLTEMDWKFNFYPWYEEPAYVTNPDRVILTPNIAKYFEKLELEHKIVLSPAQMAWYAKKSEDQKDLMTREFPSTPDEAFAAAIEGAYYGELMAQAEQAGRVTDVPYDPRLKVETWWDIGYRDDMSIWFVQRHPSGKIAVIDFYSNSGEVLSHYAKVLDKKPYRYSRHIGPHDSANHDVSGIGLTRAQVAESLGMRPWITAARIDVLEGIDAARNVIPVCWFDQTNCAEGLKALKAYRKEWNDKLGTWKSNPRHDWSSHAADAFRTGATAPPDTDAYDFNAEIKVPSFGAV